MDKEKFDNAAFKIVRLLKNKSSEFNMRFSPDMPQDIVTNANRYIDNYLDREIVKAARELLTAAGDDIVGTPTPAGMKKYPAGKREFVCTKLSYRDPNATAHTD